MRERIRMRIVLPPILAFVLSTLPRPPVAAAAATKADTIGFFDNPGMKLKAIGGPYFVHRGWGLREARMAALLSLTYYMAPGMANPSCRPCPGINLTPESP